MLGQFEVNHTIAMRHYNALFCNRTYRAAITAYFESGAGGRVNGLQDYEFGCYLTDAALECVGHEGYAGAVSVVMALANRAGMSAASAVTMHLMNFATLDHIAMLDLTEGK